MQFISETSKNFISNGLIWIDSLKGSNSKTKCLKDEISMLLAAKLKLPLSFPSFHQQMRDMVKTKSIGKLSYLSDCYVTKFTKLDLYKFIRFYKISKCLQWTSQKNNEVYWYWFVTSPSRDRRSEWLKNIGRIIVLKHC